MRAVFLALTRTEPALGRLLSSDPEPEPDWYTTQEVLEAQVEPLEWVVPDTAMAIAWDPQEPHRYLVGEARRVRQENAQNDVLGAIRDLAEIGQVPSTTNIARYLGRPASNVNRDQTELVRAGKVAKGKKQGRVVRRAGDHYLAETRGEGVRCRDRKRDAGPSKGRDARRRWRRASCR